LAELKKWLLTYDTRVNNTKWPYDKVCDGLKESMLSELNNQFSDSHFVEDNRDGESYSASFMVQADSNLQLKPPSIGQINLQGENYKIDLLELEEWEKIYTQDFQKKFGTFLSELTQNQNPFEQLSSEIIGNAIRCYENDLHDAAVILCRTAIDSSLYLVSMFELKNDSFSERFPTAFRGNRDVNWKELKESAINLKFFTENELKFINEKVRDLGNFAAHIGTRQIREQKEWMQKYGKLMNDLISKSLSGQKVDPKEIPPGAKLHTRKSESVSAINRAMIFITDLAKRYNKPLP
jgi:hypothetical protein